MIPFQLVSIVNSGRIVYSGRLPTKIVCPNKTVHQEIEYTSCDHLKDLQPKESMHRLKTAFLESHLNNEECVYIEDCTLHKNSTAQAEG